MNWETAKETQLVQAVLALETTQEAQLFLRDLMTGSEIIEFAKRLEAARLLSMKIPYSAVQKETGLSSATIARVSKWLQGSLGGYRLILDRIHRTMPPAGGSGLH